MTLIKHIYSSNNFNSMASHIKIRRRILSILLILFLVSFSAKTNFAQEEEEEFTQGEETTQVDRSGKDPVELFNQAQEAHSKGDLTTALKLYEEAIEAFPEFPEAEFQRGTIYINFGKTLEAEKAFRRAIELRRDWTLPIAELGSLLVQRGDYIEAESLLNQAIRINNMSFPAYVALTELKIKTKAPEADLKQLLGKLQYLTTKSKIPASIWASRSVLERYLGDKESAKISIKRALAVDENNSYVLMESIENSLLEGDKKTALYNAKKLNELNPNSNSAKILLARALYSDGNSTEAIKVLDSIENPNGDVSQLKTAITLVGNDNIEEMEKLLENDAKNVSVLGRLCTLSRVEQPQKALEYCQRALEIQPNEINYAIGFGAALVQQKRYNDAVGLFKKLLEVSPENYTIKANLATALFQLQRYDEAISEYEWISKAQPDLAVTYYFLGISHDKLEQYLDAMANYQQFLKLADDSLKLEVEKVNLRLPTLQKQIKQGKGKKR